MPPSRPPSSTWDRFIRLLNTQDSLAQERRGIRRWLLGSYVAFVLPIDDPAAQAQLSEWRAAFAAYLPYDPVPDEQLHITLHQVGKLRRSWLWMPRSWRRLALPRLGEQVEQALNCCPAFEVRLGPLNAFPNVLFAEVQDEHERLRALRAHLRRALPLRARPSLPWAYIPHVTLGYWGRQPARPLVDALSPYRKLEPVRCPISRVTLTVYTVDPALSPGILRTATEEIIAEYPLKDGP